MDINQLSNELGIETELGKAALAVFLKNAQILDKKNKDYGPGNISAFGEYGVLVRVSDKVERLKNLFKSGATPNHESIQDTWMDLCNYGVIGEMCNQGKWK
jgi:hypothetical protein